MTGEYDLIFSIGEACSCSQSIRAARLQYASFPWDWLLLPTLPGRARMICEGFGDWLLEEDMRRISDNGDTDQYENTRNGILFYHDFPKGVPLAESFPAVKAKYDRRIARLTRLIEEAKRPILVVRVDSPAKASVPATLDDCRLCREMLSRRWPGKSFEMCLFSMDRGRRFSDRLEEEPEEGLLHVAFDYASRVPDAPAFAVDLPTMGAFLRARFSVRDYRTPGEMREYKALRKRRKYAKEGVRGFWGLLLKRARKHLHLT